MEIETMTYPFTNVPLPYGYAGLEPDIDTKTMQLHHDKHLQTYIDNLNAIIKDNPALMGQSLTDLLKNSYNNEIVEPIKTQILHNAGGVYNHFFFFNGLQKSTGEIILGRSPNLSNEIAKYFGGYLPLKEKMKTASLAVFGSGYAWLIRTRDGDLQVITTANQTTPVAIGATPLLCIDVWEHAYYLKNYNDRSAYFENWWRVINWLYLSKII